jgi:hypothetical protein
VCGEGAIAQQLVAGPYSVSQAQVWRVTGDEVSPAAPAELGQIFYTSAILVADVSGDRLDDLVVVDPSVGLVILRRA